MRKLFLLLFFPIIILAQNSDTKSFQELKAEMNQFPQVTNDLYGILSNNPLPDKKTMRKEFHEKNIN